MPIEFRMAIDYNRKPKISPTDFGWYNIGYLPHFDAGEIPQFITFRSYDSLPANVLDEMRQKAADDIAFRKQVEGYLDRGHGGCWLGRPIVQDSLLHGHDKGFSLIAWVIMLNHVHILLRPLVHKHLPSIMHSIKSYSAQMADRAPGRKGQFWQHESCDRYIRNEKHFYNVIDYIEMNPVTAGLCRVPEEWPFGSAHYRAQASRDACSPVK